MNDTMKRLAIEAGFVYWEEKKIIDLCLDYDKLSATSVNEFMDLMAL